MDTAFKIRDAIYELFKSLIVKYRANNDTDFIFIINAERLFLTNAGFSRKDDSLPKRLTEEPAPTGPAKGMVCHLQEMLDEYYREQGWTPDGVPLADRLKQLNLL